MTDATDPHAWLEDVGGERQLGWVKQRNASTEAELAATPQFKQLEAQIRAILDSDAKIPAVEKIGEHYYNFWKDAQHQRGLWRRTTLAEYRKPTSRVGNRDRPRRAEPGRRRELGLARRRLPQAASRMKRPALPGRAVARRRRRRRHPRVRPHEQGRGSRTASSAPKPRARWAGSTATTSTCSPISVPAR